MCEGDGERKVGKVDGETWKATYVCDKGSSNFESLRVLRSDIET